MLKILRAFFSQPRQLGVILCLMLASGLCLGLLGVRIVHTRSFTHLYLLWNLHLAWWPALSALLAYNLYRRSFRLRWPLIAGCALMWLVFFPNAPYLITDLTHLRPQPGIPFWYDIILLMTHAWVGTFLGLVSLLIMQELVRKAAGTLAGWLFALGVMGLSSLGVYLGRFLRWNSWDAFLHPFSVLADVLNQVRHPFENFHTSVFTVLFTFLLISMYLILKAVTQFQWEVQQR